MSLTVSTIARHTNLTTLARVQGDMGISADADIITRLIRDASAAIESYCGRSFAREAVVETLPGYGGIHLQVTRRPVITVSVVSQDGDLITDSAIEDRDGGTLYRRLGWAWAAQVFPGLSGGRGMFDMGIPLPGQEEPQVSVTYVGGYLLPENNRVAVNTISVDAADDSFNDSAGLFPELLKAGDVVEASGFTNAANNGRFVVTGTPTTSKIVVSASLTTEAAGASHTLLFQPPAGCRPIGDLERACVEAVKSWYQTRKQDSSVVEVQTGATRVRRTEADDAALLGLPAVCIGLLKPWMSGVRRAA